MPHIHDRIDFCVEVFIVYNNRVLLRKHDKYKIWLSVGGHVELDEDPNSAAVREVREEVGLDIKLFDDSLHSQKVYEDSAVEFRELVPPRFMNMHRINPSHEHIAMIYFARSTSDELVLSDSEVSGACRWFSVYELDDESFGFRENIKLYAKQALKVLKS